MLTAPEGLGRTQKLWDKLIADLARDHALEPEGWVRTALPLRKGKRRIVYLSPRGGFSSPLSLWETALSLP